jgi:Na+/H+ antiporter NhaD/arsenite permease-like protein
MVLQVELDRSGLLDAVAVAVAARGWGPKRLLVAVTFGAGLLSALLVNDAVCLLAAPLVLRLTRAGGLPPVPFLLALAVGCNVGGVATLAGTPQCMLVGEFSGISYARWAAVMVPVAAVLLAIASAVLLAVHGRALSGERVRAALPAAPLDRPRARRFVVTLSAVVVGFFAGLPLAWVALAGACLSALLRMEEPRENLARLDWPLLVLFASLFVVVGGVAHAGWVDRGAAALTPWLTDDPSTRPFPFAVASLVGSNVFSNVPFVLALHHGYGEAGDPFWFQIGLTSTLAGNLTLVGSVANLIVAEAAQRDGVEVGFLEHLKTGVPVTLATTAAGIGLLSLFGLA